MSDWQPKSLSPSENYWEDINSVQFIMQEGFLGHAQFKEIPEQSSALRSIASLTVPAQSGWSSLLAGPETRPLGGQGFASQEWGSKPRIDPGASLDLERALVDFIRRFLPGSGFDPATASTGFRLAEGLLELLAIFLTIPGGAVLAHVFLTALGRETPDLSLHLREESDLSIFDALNSRLGKLLRKLLRGIDQTAIPSPSWLSGAENYIHTVANNYSTMEALEAFEQPDFLSRLFRWGSDHMHDSIYPGQKAGIVGVVFYVVGLILQTEYPEIADALFTGGDISFNLSTLFNIGNRLSYLQYVDNANDLLFLTNDAGEAVRLMDDLAPGVLGRTLIYTDGVLGAVRYVDAIGDLLNDPALNPYLSGASAWRARISTMLTGISGAFSCGALLLTLIAGGAALVPAMIILGTICSIAALLVGHWEQITNGFSALRETGRMITQVILPFRLYQGWQWFDNALGRPIRENVLQPIGRGLTHVWNGMTGLVQTLAGE